MQQNYIFRYMHIIPKHIQPRLKLDSPEVLLDIAKEAVKQSRSCPWTVYIHTLNIT